MIVISDTSPITNLIQIGHLSLLMFLFEKIILPTAVYDELCEIPTQQEILDGCDWILVMEASEKAFVSQLETHLDKGEAEAIALSVQTNANFLLIDEIKGRTTAEGLGLKIVGLLGILIKAKENGLLSKIAPLLQELLKLGFRIKPSLLNHILNLVGEANEP